MAKENKPHPNSPFPVTQWSLVARARHVETSIKRQALGELLQSYFPAVRLHLIRRRGVRPHDVDDVIQGFIASQVMERELIEKVEKEKGKFRTFLLTALDRYLSKLRRGEGVRQRRLGSQIDVDHVPEPAAVASTDTDIPQMFDVEWARSVLNQTLSRMALKCRSSGRDDVWNLFELRLIQPIIDNQPPPPYQQILKTCGLRTPLQASNMLVTGKRMFERILKAVIAEYAIDERQIDEEILDLKNILARSTGQDYQPPPTPPDMPPPPDITSNGPPEKHPGGSSGRSPGTGTQDLRKS